MKNRILFSVLFLIVFLSNNIYSQWLAIPTVNNPICTQVASQGGSTITSDGSGGAIIAWADQRNGNLDIYAQNIKNNGTLQWAVDGVAICTAPDVQSSLAIESDGSGGAIITWQDFRNGSDYDIYAQKINSNGAVQWALNGVALCTATADQTLPKIVSDGSGGAFITWQSGSGFNIDIYAQGINSGGTVLWPATGVAISTASFNQSNPAIVGDGTNGAIITWNDVRNGADWDIYAQKINNSGVQWTANGVPVSTVTGSSQSSPAIASDGSNGAIITWMDDRNGNASDIYAQRINSSGGVVWTSVDVAISTVTGNQQFPAIVSDGIGGAIMTWQDFRNGDPDIYAQGVTSNGVFTWLQDGIAICTAPGFQYGAQYSSPTIVSDGSNGAIITWYDNRSLISLLDIYAQGINNSGVVTWVQDGVAICTATNSQTGPTIVSDGGSGAIVAWVDGRSGNTDIYASKIEQSIGVLDSGSICGIKFNDLNGNGVQDPGELGLPNWEINLSFMQATGFVNFIDSTDANGNYCFHNLLPGQYRVWETQQSLWQQTYPAYPGVYGFILGSGQQKDSVDFGNKQLPQLGSICGIKFNDLDGNGVQDPGELGLQNWIINLTYQNVAGFVTLTDTTDANGNYCFDSLQPGGPYTVSETQQALWQQTFPIAPGTYTITLASGEHRDSVNFGNRLSTVGGICDSLSATASKITPGDCLWSLSLNQPANVTGISSIQILALSPNQFTTGTGLGTNYQTWFTSGTNTYTPPTGIVPGGNLNNFFNMSLSYVTSPQIIVVNWLNNLGSVVCSDTVLLNCQISCTSIISDTVTCVGNNYNFAYTFTNNATYSVSNIVYTLQGPPNVTIAPLTAILSPVVASGSNSTLQNILITGAVPGDIVSILAQFKSPDGCCWCYDTLKVIMPICGSVCDSVSVQAQGSPTDCCYDISLTNNSSMVFSNIEFELLSGGMYSTYATTSGPGWAFTNIFPNNLINLVKFPIAQGIGNGTFNNILDLCIRQYSSPNQIIEVRWIKDGQVICRDTLRFECDSLYNPTDSCSQVINDTLICLPNGTVQYNFQVQNNSNIISTGYGIHPTTPGVIFSDTLFNISIMPGQVSPMDSIIISGIGQGQNLCFYTAIFTTVVPGDSLYNYCCHSDTMCITTPVCGGQDSCLTKVWSPLGTGINNGTNGEVWALAVIGSDLYVGGNFTTAGGNTVNHIAKWNGSSWSALISSNTGVNGINGVVTALAVIGTDLYAGGWFTNAGGIPAENIAKWDGTNWSALGSGLSAAGAINALAVMGNNLYATSYILDPALGGPENLIVKWDGANWSLFSVMDDYVSSFLVDGSNLYAGGQFTMAGTVPASHVAKWNGANWSSLGLGTNYFIGGTGLEMMAGNLYAGGRFTTADNNPANFIAKWDGSNWSPFLSGINNGMNNAVEGLAVMGTDLYASGSFTTAGGVSANSVAKWNGTSWSPLGSGMNDGVWRLAVIGNDLYAGGIFTTAGSVSANYIAKYSCGIPTSVGEDKTENTLPKSFKLEQNYPNPFNPMSTIRYDIPKTSFVKISVYDILGREIKVLVDEEKNPGSYEVIFDAKELASGIYFYAIRSGEFTQIKKMILMK